MNQDYGKRITQLFVPGTEIILDADSDPPLVAWAQKLSPFEREEARTAAQAAQNRIRLTLRRGETDDDSELALFTLGLADQTAQQLGELIADLDAGRLYLKAGDEIRSNPDWADRLQVLDHAEQIADRAPGDPEARTVADINAEYLTEHARIVERLRQDLVTELLELGEERLRDRARDIYIDSRAAAASMLHYRFAEFFFGTRACHATRDDNERWQHTECDHRQRVFDSIAEAQQMPDEMFELLRDGLGRITMTDREAKNSDRQGSSSASPPLPEASAEGSDPSAQTGTSTKQDGTSSSPSTTPSPSSPGLSSPTTTSPPKRPGSTRNSSTNGSRTSKNATAPAATASRSPT